jgi:hypothetical protein
MSAILAFPIFCTERRKHEAACANATFARAIKLDYSLTIAQGFARDAKRDCTDWETPAECAFRIVRPKHVSATVANYTPGGAA